MRSMEPVWNSIKVAVWNLELHKTCMNQCMDIESSFTADEAIPHNYVEGWIHTYDEITLYLSDTQQPSSVMHPISQFFD